ncbi:MAG: sn-glycerol-3-phosphate ABC transporter ATP-binding protein UgpC [Comamonadaceae bacterium]|nr:MAG: sn-glycerol-3-phosphate ABC transporter ATP-binding protein UgpC [Comamonadaceae bacterium]
MASILIDNVSKSYGAVDVLRGVTVPIADGEFVVLVGPSGCGKSTLLRMISGLEGISGGEISIGSKVINHLAAKDRDIAMVFQNYALYPHMTVAQNMSFSMKMRGEKKEEIQRRLDKAAAILGLEPLMDRVPRQLSGGQRQRVAMGRAIVRDPKVFLFDEPLSNLDAKLRVQMRAEIKDLHQRLGTTMIYVTHDQIEAMTMADRIVVMRDGQVEQTGQPLELYDRPANLFVAGFIGSPGMNLLPGALMNDAGATGFRAECGVSIAMAGNSGAASLPSGRAVCGIRPEHIQITATGDQAVVLAVDPTGPETHITAQWGSAKVTVVSRERFLKKPGETIALLADPEHVHLFDEASGKRLN